MLLPETRLDTLIEQLRALPAPDRRAILARLSPQHREQIRRHLQSIGAPASPYSPDIAARVAALRNNDASLLMTEPGKAALGAVLAAAGAVHSAPAAASLADLLAGLWRKWASA